MYCESRYPRFASAPKKSADHPEPALRAARAPQPVKSGMGPRAQPELMPAEADQADPAGAR